MEILENTPAVSKETLSELYSASFNMINDIAKKWIIGLSIFAVVSFGALAYCMHYVRTSELFLGKRCLEIY